MKQLALVLCFYILGLATAPLIQLGCEKFTAKCEDSCEKQTAPIQKNDQCDNRGCCLLMCCYSTLMLFFTETKYNFSHYFPDLIQNNYNFTQIFDSLNLFDIWHPPKTV